MDLIAKKQVGALGRIVIPSETRKLCGFEEGTEVGVYVVQGMIVIKRLDDEELCSICNGPVNEDAMTIHGKTVCRKCTGDIVTEEIIGKD